MRLAGKMALNLFEGAEGIGIRREDLARPLGIDPQSFTGPRAEIEWETLVALLERLSVMVGGDVERLRAVGGHITTAQSYVFFRRLARTVISLRNLYLAGERWVAPADIPHLVIRTTFPAEDRLRLRCTIPEPHAPSAAYLHTLEGFLCALPAMLGLPPAAIVSSSVNPRDLDLVLQLPPSRSILGRLRRGIRARLHVGDSLAVLEQQRREIAEGLAAMQRTTTEITSIFERLPDLVIIHRDGVILWANRAVVKTLGFERDDELVGRQLLDLIDPTTQSMVRTRMSIDDVTGMPDVVEGRIITRDGSLVPVEVSPTQIVSFGGKPARLIVGRDVTERMRLQQRILTADRLASIGMLAAGVAHEVNNPLAYVLNNVEMVVKDLAPLGEQTRTSREALAVALEGVDRIRIIVRDLLALSRVDEFGIGPVDVRGVVESTLALAAQSIDEHADLDRDLRHVPLVRGTPARIGQVLLNLIANALEAMPMANRSENRLRVAVLPSATGGAVVEVSDNGGGIAPEHVGRVFDPFFTTKSMGRGTGLGLAISQRLVDEIGGELSFDSVPERGSTFRLSLVPAEPEGPLPTRADARR